MKQFFLILLSLCLFISYATAQVNLREGYIITLAGDTLHGDIDYRSDFMNTQRCVFLANGATAPKTFLPGEIRGYRFEDNGRYYVSKAVPTSAVDKTPKLAFAEYVVKGDISFYYLCDRHADLYLLENKEGELVAFENDDKDSNLTHRRKRLAYALLMLNKSEKAQEKLWKRDTNKEQVKRVTLLYNNDVCPDGQCEIYEYPAAKTPKAERCVHWAVKAGYSPQKFEILNNESIPTAICPGYRVSVGIDVHLARLCKGLYVQLHANFAQAKNNDISKNVQEDVSWHKPIYNTYKYHYTERSLKAGLAYELPLFRTSAKCSLFAGLDIGSYTHKVESTEQYYNFTEEMASPVKSYYGGVGFLYPVGRHYVVLEGQFYCKTAYFDYWPNKRPAVMVGWRF